MTHQPTVLLKPSDRHSICICLIISKLPPLTHVDLLKHERNKHIGGARNTALKVATGDYVIFLDADDYWNARNALSVLAGILSSHESLDVLRSVSWNNAAYDARPTLENVDATGVDAAGQTIAGIEYLSGGKFFTDVWTSCYRREFLIDNDLYFRENVAYEDGDWATKVFWMAQRVLLISFPFYIHRLNPESTAMKPRPKAFVDNILGILAIDDFVKSVEMPPQCRRACYAWIKRSIMSYVMISRNFPVGTSLQCLKNLRRSLLTDTGRYDLTASEQIKMWLFAHCPWLLVGIVRYLTLTKRLVLKCVRR